MAILIALGIAMAAVGFVAAPFFFGARQGARVATATADEQASLDLQELMAEKETVYAAIQELDFDLQAGKLSVEDHGSLRERNEERAAAVLKAIDDHTAATAAPQASRKARREKRRG
jgi:flagellar basal body-associated protein FliL